MVASMIDTLALFEISIPEPMLAYHASRVVEIAQAIRAGGERPVLTVVERDDGFSYVLVDGKDELAALKLVGAGMARVRVVGEPRQEWRGAHLQKRRV
jgi:hypothetical protein